MDKSILPGKMALYVSRLHSFRSAEKELSCQRFFCEGSKRKWGDPSDCDAGLTSVEGKGEGGVSGGKNTGRQCSSGQWGVLEPEVPIGKVLDLTRMHLPTGARCAQSQARSNHGSRPRKTVAGLSPSYAPCSRRAEQRVLMAAT